MQIKDFARSVQGFQEALVSTPNDALSYYRLGVSALQTEPPMHQDAFWALARAITLKMQNEAQVRTYLRGQLLRYQLTVCEPLIDAQMNKLIALAGTTDKRPENFSIPSREALNKVLEGSTIDTIVADLRGGGDKAELTWIAACGSEFPELGAKVFEVADNGESVSLKVFTAGKVEDIEAATEPNMEVKVEGQPGTKRLKKDDQIVYSGALDNYTPEPFMIHLSKAKVKDEFIPPDEEPAKKTPAKKTPAKKTPPKKPPV
jgi:hypothetical protein